ncbi:MAG TPA: hypothetical protein VGI06_09290, partial [Acidimicrobiales bacterium]
MPSGNASSTSTTKTPTEAGTGRRLTAAVATAAAEEGTAIAWGGPLVAAVAVLWATRHEWGARAASGDDVMGHMVRTRWGIEHLLLHGHLDGWMPTFAVGYQEFLFYGPGFTWLAAIVRLLTLGRLSDAGAVKVLAIGSVALFPAAVAYLARSLGLTRRAAGVAAMLSLLVDNPIGLGITSTFGTGQVPDQVGEVLGCVAIGALLRVVQHGRRRDVAVAAVAAAATLVTHSITVLVAVPIVVITVPVLWVTERPRLAPVRSFAVALVLAAGLAAFWLVPFAVHEPLHGPATTYTTPALAGRLAAIMRGTFLFRRHVAALVLVGMALAVLRAARGRPWGAALVLTPVAYIAVDRLVLHRFPGSEPALYL